uniref:Stathmin n=1 Tax=Myripristis murdjan TaxID=586833 RepID=A0A667Y3W5_9TELE
MIPLCLEVKSLTQRLAGQAFEVILGAEPSQDKRQPLALPPRRGVSLEELQRRQEAAEERRKSQEAAVLKQLAEKREREREVLHKARQENSAFSRKTEEKLQHKMEVNKENREARLHELRQRLQLKASLTQHEVFLHLTQSNAQHEETKTKKSAGRVHCSCKPQGREKTRKTQQVLFNTQNSKKMRGHEKYRQTHSK